MITIECPWCDEKVNLETRLDETVTCDGCRVTVEIAPDPAGSSLAHAARAA
jgi:hypothetical protein